MSPATQQAASTLPDRVVEARLSTGVVTCAPHLDGDGGAQARRVEAGHLLAALLVAQQALERRHDQVVEVALVGHVLAELLRHRPLHALLLGADEAVQQHPAGIAEAPLEGPTATAGSSKRSVMLFVFGRNRELEMYAIAASRPLSGV